jgi:hypothetical protein
MTESDSFVSKCNLVSQYTILEKQRLNFSLPPAILQTPAIKHIPTYQDRNSDEYRGFKGPIIERMESDSESDTDECSEPSRTEAEVAIKPKKRRKEVQRERKETPRNHISDIRIEREVTDIFEKSKTNANKWAHNSWKRICEDMEPLPYLLMKRSP